MILVDTSVWIEFLRGKNKEIGRGLLVQLNQRNVLAASPVFGELLQGVKDARERAIILTYWHNLPKEDEQQLMVEAGKLSADYKLFGKGVGLIDCAILSLAIKGRHFLWTLDKRLGEAATELSKELR